MASVIIASGLNAIMTGGIPVITASGLNAIMTGVPGYPGIPRMVTPGQNDKRRVKRGIEPDLGTPLTEA